MTWILSILLFLTSYMYFTTLKYIKCNIEVDKTVLNCHSKIDKTKILKINGSLMKVESIVESRILLTCIKQDFS